MPTSTTLKIAFLLRHRDNYFTYEDTEEVEESTDDQPESYSDPYLSSGLYNSARLVAEMLRDRFGYNTMVAQLPDSNHIDKYVTEHKPDVVILEAYWVTPDKLRLLNSLHPKITWVVRNHSSIPFLSLEGVVMTWSQEYVDIPKVILSNNDPRTNAEIARLIGFEHEIWDRPDVFKKVVLLPNYYPAILREVEPLPFDERVIDISSFGAIRPLKNQLIQAIAAITFCEDMDLTLRFHMNTTRLEQGGEPIYKNLKAVFDKNPRHQFIEHPWLPHDEFLDILQGVDIAMQVSFAETFNITTADAVTFGIPVVVSPEIWWAHLKYQVDPNSVVAIEHGLFKAFRSGQRRQGIREVNLRRLAAYDEWSARIWDRFLKSPAVMDKDWEPPMARDDFYCGALPNYPEPLDA